MPPDPVAVLRPLTVVALRALVAAAVAVALVGCGSSRGVMITGDGRMVAATAENVRDEVARMVVDAVRPLAPDAETAVVIDELPRYGDARRDPVEGWYFQAIHARVVLRSAAPVDRDAVIAAATDALRGRTRFRDSTHVAVEVVAPATPPASATSTAASQSIGQPPGVAAATPSRGPRRYAAHAGDTLADLSTAFYGTAEDWRLIRDANPQVDFTALRPGEELVIPPTPAPAPPSATAPSP